MRWTCIRCASASHNTPPGLASAANTTPQVANLIGADPKEIIFTSGATESNNLAIKGVANFYKDKKRHIVTSQTEHKCVLDSAR
jgi:cysteine desulfurase